MSQVFIQFAEIQVDFFCKDKRLALSVDSGGRLFQEVDSFKKPSFSIEVLVGDDLQLRKQFFKCVFKGKPVFIGEGAYEWSVFSDGNSYCLVIDLQGYSKFSSVHLHFSQKEGAKAYFTLRSENYSKPVAVDPLFYPLGPLIFFYLVHFNKGLLVHASGVVDGEEGYLFTGVSGVGKSTMAGLWEQKGAYVINDDRLALMKQEDAYFMHNTPMVYYDDIPKKGRVKGIFLLVQANHNYIKKISGVVGLSRFMANCIQQFFDPSMVETHLEVISDLVSKVPVYELGVVPTCDVVDFVRNEMGRKDG